MILIFPSLASFAAIPAVLFSTGSFIISYLGIIKAGKIVHIAPPEISENSLIKQINSAGSSLILCSEKVFKNITILIQNVTGTYKLRRDKLCIIKT